ncbi:raffinose/stachyose/melibiose transport system permease protein [Paenibacillus sp. UNCCL117]|uniref:carbohydrate ABC transporter permease n=1 Tax=unclassified Paenibacillus TaxID=185978 RepID=UPI0008856589|nr:MULTISPECIES: sugar ABC transporter permease [unclassified Paenibacillus]SDC16646.1 raffinose/stachyose/melibiose transport system permease protein [Paenibacillus sp. cl123]SFW17831.1 raffinose/stachyose/melibiose transport system permease protein [Paenibacillus sp. UNCCL117]
MISEKSLARKIGNQLFYTGPTVLIFFMVMIVPFLYGIYLTFFKWDGISSDMPFVGLDNYLGVFRDAKFWSSMTITIKYVIATVFLINAVGFLLAFLVVTGIKRQNFFRAAFFTPSLIGGLVLGFLWQFLFNNFFVNIGNQYGIAMLSKSWLGNPDKAFWALVVVTVWHYAGYMMVIFIAGLMNVPQDILEAATIDGTSNWQKLIHMILPLMVPSFIITIFLSLQRGFMVYDLNYSLTGGGPFESTVFVSMHVFDKAFRSYDYGMGQAEAIVLFVIVASVTMLQVYFSKKKEVEI